MPYSTGYHAPFAWISSRPVSWLTRDATGWQSRSLQQGIPLGDRSPTYHSCDSAGAGMPRSRQAPRPERPTEHFLDSKMRALRSCGSENPQCIIVIMAMPTLFGDPSLLREQGGLGLRPARPPGLFLPRLRLRAWWPLVCPDPTSLSTSVDTGYRGSPDSKSDDNARAKCGTRERRQDQDHDHPSRQGNNNPQIALSSSADRH